MALGRNLKLDRLIPPDQLRTEDKTESDVSQEVIVKDSLEALPESIEDLTELDKALLPIDTGDLKIVFTPSKRKTQKRVFAAITGALTIANASLMKERISELFTHFDHVEITLSEVTAIDISAIQLFNLMRVNFYRSGKYTYINAEFSKPTRQLLTACGYAEFTTQKTAAN